MEEDEIQKELDALDEAIMSEEEELSRDVIPIEQPQEVDSNKRPNEEGLVIGNVNKKQKTSKKREREPGKENELSPEEMLVQLKAQIVHLQKMNPHINFTILEEDIGKLKNVKTVEQAEIQLQLMLRQLNSLMTPEDIKRQVYQWFYKLPYCSFSEEFAKDLSNDPNLISALQQFTDETLPNFNSLTRIGFSIIVNFLNNFGKKKSSELNLEKRNE